MTTAFTAPTTGTNWLQNVNNANELVSAYSYHRRVLGQSAITPVAEGENAQDPTLWNEMQLWIEDNCGSFVDHTQAVAGDFTGQDSIPTWTWSNLLAAAGMTGWRRAQVWPAGSPPTWLTEGHIQDGDIIGPWNFEDLQKMFSLLRWTAMDGTEIVDNEEIWGDGEDFNCGMAYGYAQTGGPDSWDTHTWNTPISTQFVYSAYSLCEELGSTKKTFHTSRQRGKAKVSGVFAGMYAEADVYLLPSETDILGVNHFLPIDYPTMENLKWWRGQTIARNHDTTRISQLFGDVRTDPLTACTHIVCPISTTEWGEGVIIIGAKFIFKWEFPNQT